MKINMNDTHFSISLSRLEKLASLHGDMDIPLEDITDATVDVKPTQAIFSKSKRGLRIPGYFYLGTTLGGRHFLAARRNKPALHLKIRGDDLSEVTVSTPDAERFAERLSGR